jgi:hypothetical protein
MSMSHSMSTLVHQGRFTARSFDAVLGDLVERSANVTVMGAFDAEELPISVRGRVSELAVLDSDENGSLRSRVVVRGNLKQLARLVVSCHGEVHVFGEVAPHTAMRITATALCINGVPVLPVTRSRVHLWCRTPGMHPQVVVVADNR